MERTEAVIAIGGQEVFLSPQRYHEKEIGLKFEEQAFMMKGSPHSNRRAEIPSTCTDAVSRKTMSDIAEPLEEIVTRTRRATTALRSPETKCSNGTRWAGKTDTGDM
jgi:hypothetical protein